MAIIRVSDKFEEAMKKRIKELERQHNTKNIGARITIPKFTETLIPLMDNVNSRRKRRKKRNEIELFPEIEI